MGINIENRFIYLLLLAPVLIPIILNYNSFIHLRNGLPINNSSVIYISYKPLYIKRLIYSATLTHGISFFFV